MLGTMNIKTTGRFLGAVAILAGAPLYAQQAPRCSDLFDDAQRLACYDAAFGKPSRAPAGNAAAPSTSAPAARAGVTAPASVAAPSPAPVVRAAPVAPVAAPAPAPAATPEPAAQPLVGTSSVTQVSRTANGRFIATLENGQVWAQLERDPTAEVQVGDQVTVRKASLGSYMMVTRSGVRTRVRLQ